MHSANALNVEQLTLTLLLTHAVAPSTEAPKQNNNSDDNTTTTASTHLQPLSHESDAMKIIDEESERKEMLAAVEIEVVRAKTIRMREFAAGPRRRRGS